MKRTLSLIACILSLFLFCCACLGPTDDPSGKKQSPAPSPTQSLASPEDDILAVHFLDVGQGDAIFLELPGNRTMLIDAAEADQGPGIVSYIRNLGYQRIDYLVATHPHADHIGGMEHVVRTLDIDQMIMPRAETNTRTYENLLLAIQQKGLSIKAAKAGTTLLQEGSLHLRIVAPTETSYQSLNNYSIVLHVRYGQTAFLLTGDAETLSEDSITEEISANVLKIGHHGSSTSTGQTFLERVNPQYAIISCGAGNSYNHPHREILDRLTRRNITILRTDLDGTIVFHSNGAKLWRPEVDGPSPAATSASNGKITPGTELTPSATPTGTPAAPSNTPASIIVYVTNTGTKYHLDGCSSLQNSCIPLPLEEARKSHAPCQRCHPPE